MKTLSTYIGLMALPLLSSYSAWAQSTPKFFGPELPAADISTLALADMNGDGILDCITGAPYSRSVTVHLGNSAGRFTAGSPVTVGRFGTVVRVADMNRDGRPDILALNPTDNTLSVRLATGSGTYSGPDLPFPYYSASDLHIADVTGDGILDYLVNHRGNGLQVYPGDGTGGFTFAGYGVLGTWFDNTGSFAVYPADVNGDGKLDIVTTGFDKLQMRLGNGDGTFGDIVSIPVPGTPTQEVVVGDYNSDGRLDLIGVDGNNQQLHVRLQNAAGNFVAAPTLTTQRIPYPVRVGDFNGDGNQDLVVGSDQMSQGATGGAPMVEIFYGAGTGSFRAGELVPVGSDTGDIALGDVNRDGRLDFVSANYDGTYSVRLNSQLPTRLNLASSTPTRFQSVANQIQWKPGSASDRVVFIREVRPGRAPLTQPVDGVAYLANQQTMSNTTHIGSGTYTLGRAVAADSLATLQNGSIGHVYEVGIFEYTVDPVIGPMYRRDKSVQYTFTAARFSPALKASLSNNVPSLAWEVSAQYKAVNFQVQSSPDGVSFTAVGSPVAALDSTTTPTSYTQTGSGSQTAYTYYRVQMTHTDGTVLYSNVVPLGTKPLPVELVSFTGKLRPDGLAHLNWATASEKNSAYFEVERSTDGQRFVVAGRVNAAGTSTQQRTYDFTEPQPLMSATYYRLHQVDLDGSNTYSHVIILQPQVGPLQLTVAPNPASSSQQASLRLSGLSSQAGPVHITVRTLTSQVVHRQTLTAAPVVDWSWSLAGYSPGLYLIEVLTSAGRQVQRLQVQ